MTNFRTRTLVNGSACMALAAAGMLIPAASASAASSIGTPSSAAAGSSFTVDLTGLDATKTYRLDLTGASTTDTTAVSESNTCSSVTGKTTITCTITENTAGAYDLKLYENGTRIANQAVTVGKAAAAPTAPVATDLANATNDAITVTYDPSIVWTVDGTTVTWTNGDKTPVGTKQDVPVTGFTGTKDVVVKAAPATDFAFPAGTTTEWTLRLTDSATAPKALEVPAASAPKAIDQDGVANDQVTLTKVDGLDWVVAGTKVVFGANETSKTITVTPDAKTGKVDIVAQATPGNYFAGNVTSKDFSLTYNVTTAVKETRVAGSSRVATAVEISKKYFDASTDTVYVANALSYADALAAGPAAAKDNAPLLLTMPKAVDTQVIDEIKRLSPAKIKIAGGENAVSPEVEAALKALAPVERFEGDNRYSTAADVAKQWTTTGGTVYLAWGGHGARDFADALSAGSAAAKEGAPLLLSEKTELMGPTVETLARLNPTKVVLVGGPDILSSDLIAKVKAVAPAADVTRLAGKDRYATSAEVIDKVTGKKANPDASPAVLGSTQVFFATGLDFPDALAGVPAAHKLNAPLALTQTRCLPVPVKTQLDRMSLAEVIRLGGPTAIGDFGPGDLCAQ